MWINGAFNVIRCQTNQFLLYVGSSVCMIYIFCAIMCEIIVYLLLPHQC
jgi:hypothetical protein